MSIASGVGSFGSFCSMPTERLLLLNSAPPRLLPYHSRHPAYRLAHTAVQLSNRGLVLCNSSSSSPPPGPGTDDDDGETAADQLENMMNTLRKWFGVDPTDAPDMEINPGQSVMDIEQFFASGRGGGGGGGGSNTRSRRPPFETTDAPYTAPSQTPQPPPSGSPFRSNNSRSTSTSSSRDSSSTAPSSSSSSSSMVNASDSALDDWSGGVREDWDEWEGTPAVADIDDNIEAAELREQVIERRRARRGRRTTVRDEYLRPIVDLTGIYNRLALGEREAEERVFVEAITNQYESREALRYGAILLGVPLTVGFIISHVIAGPLWNYAESLEPNVFALSDGQKVAGAMAMHREEVRLRLEASIGQAPPLTDRAMVAHLHTEALHFSGEMREYNRQSMLNVVSDSTSGAVLFVLLIQDTSQRAILFRTIGRVFAGLSDTAKAFLIILVTDTLLGYHSEEGWTAGLNLLSHHYGWHTETDNLHIFVATVPVLLDSLFKYWIFVGLNKVDPAAAVTLRQVNRH